MSIFRSLICVLAYKEIKFDSLINHGSRIHSLRVRMCIVLWMKETLSDFGLKFSNVPIKCDNTSSIKISNNPVQHPSTKYIEIRYHFLRDHAQKGDIALDFVRTEDQLADIFTKPLNENQFVNIRRQLGVISL